MCCLCRKATVYARCIYFGILLSFTCRGFGTELQNESRSHVKTSCSWRDRQQALKLELKSNKLFSLETQEKVIQTLEQETADPNWNDLAEGQDYEDYYGHLIELCEKIAEDYGSPAAWRALVYSLYNLESPFGQWLIAQPQTFPLYLEMLHVGEDGRPGFAKKAIAGILARCTVPNLSDCSSVLAKRDELMKVIRAELFMNPLAKSTVGQNHSELDTQLTSSSVLGSIQALGVCGNSEDLLLLEKLAGQYASKKIIPEKSPAAEDREAVLWLIHNSERKIKDRLSTH